jgi:protein-tyrosine phosphatase
MRPELYWIDVPNTGRLAIMPRPRAGDWLDGEIAGWRQEGVDVVLSLLETSEITELGLQNEARLCNDAGVEFISFPIADRGVPASMRDAAVAAKSIIARLTEGKGVGVHCRAGIGRSALFAASVLVLLGMTPDTALHVIGKARGVEVPDTDGQRDWVAKFHEAITNDRILSGKN